MSILEAVSTEMGSALTLEQAAKASQLADWLTTIITAEANRQGIAIPASTLQMVLTLAVADSLKYPDASTSTTVSVDDASVTTRRAVRDQLTLTDAWWRLLGLTPPRDDASSGVHSVTPAFARGGYYGDGCGW